MPRFHRILLIVNPVAGLGQGVRVCQRLQRRLQTLGCHCEVRKTTGAGQACNWARLAGKDGFELIVAIGGDGTLQEVAAGLVAAPVRIPVAHLPVGTANVIAMALSLPWSTRLAVEVIQSGKVLPFDLGYLPDHDRYFLLMAACGFPARVIQDSPRRWKRLFGFLTYLAAAVRNALVPQRARLRIETDTEQLTAEAHTVLVTNIGRIREIGLKVAPDTSPHDGKFDVAIIASRTVWDVIRILLRLLSGRYREPPRLWQITAERVNISAEPALPVQIDGEVLGTTPLKVEILPDAIEILVPRSYRRR